MLRAKSRSSVPLSSIALMLSSASRQGGITGLPVAKKLDLILETAVLDADLDGLLGVEFEVLGVTLKGVGAPLKGVGGSSPFSDGDGVITPSLAGVLPFPKDNSTPPLSDAVGDTKYIHPFWMSYLISLLLYIKTVFG